MSVIDEEVCANRLLAGLPQSDRESLATRMTLVRKSTGALLHDAGEEVNEAYFPCDGALASFAVSAEAGARVEAALVGSEGAIGGIVSPGALPAFSRAEVQHGGRFLCIRLEDLHAMEEQSPALKSRLSRYADCLLAQVLQGAACNAVHPIEQRAARWLVAASQRTGETVLPLTQDRLADMLGVGRSFVNRVLKRFRAAGLVESRRGALVIHDLAGLEALACDCNDRIRAHFEEVLEGVHP
jgi:CRP-like cAMP-binding protein